MTTRQTAAQEQQDTPGVANLPTGYENPPVEDPEIFWIPPCGIADVDEGLLTLFQKEIGFRTRRVASNRTTTGYVDVGVPGVVFATGERFALAKRLKPLRDKNKVLILPLISIRRTTLEMSAADSRGMNQSTGALVLKRKLDRTEDRSFQAMLNRFGLSNLPEFSPGTRRPTSGNLSNSDPKRVGALLDPETDTPVSNLYEIIVCPQPRWFTAVYEVILWSEYQEHMNYLLETMMSSFLPQGKDWKINTPKGYWFLASVEEMGTSGDNFENWSGSERNIRYTFTVRVQGYVFAPQGPGNMVPVRRYLSSPSVVFEVSEPQGEGREETTTLEAVSRAPLVGEGFVLTDPEETVVAQDAVKRKGKSSRILQKKVILDPRTGQPKVRYLTIDNTEARGGETVYSVADPDLLGDILSGG